MAVSKKRQKKNHAAEHDVLKPEATNPSWLVPTAVSLLIIGPAWIVVYYIAKGQYPVPDIGNWNMVIGFGFLAAAMVLFTRWK
ncbi:cell division protein CrgA [Demequina aurantiaca]|uniref:cell division protein CrgA n=1 Tax=Demequina aurantiaca TaxID=676200 RepID=UPI000AE5A222|nr:cell division protein CrgA [Demequina aurantiaca]